MEDSLAAAALELLRQLAAGGEDEAATFLQQHVMDSSTSAALPHDPIMGAGAGGVAGWRGGRRALLSEDHSLSSGATAVYIVICVLLVCFAGMMAGLTLGLLSLDK